MVRRHAWVTFLFCLLAGLPDLYGQTTESKLAWLESLRPQERQARLIEAARKEDKDGYWTAYMTNATRDWISGCRICSISAEGTTPSASNTARFSRGQDR